MEVFQYSDARIGSGLAEGLQVAEISRKQTSPNQDETPVSKTELATLLARAKTEAFREGETRARQEFESTLASERARIATVLQQFENEKREYYTKVEAELVNLSLAIAAKVLHREAQVDRMLLTGVVRVALENLQKGSRVTIRVGPDDVSAWKKYFDEHHPADLAVQVVEDVSVQSQNCVLETSVGTAEFGIEPQLREIEQGFFDLLAHRPTK